MVKTMSADIKKQIICISSNLDSFFFTCAHHLDIKMKLVRFHTSPDAHNHFVDIVLVK